MSSPWGLLRLARSTGEVLWLASRQFEPDISHSLCMQGDGAVVYSDKNGTRVLWASSPAASAASGPFTALIRNSSLQVRGLGRAGVETGCPGAGGQMMTCAQCRQSGLPCPGAKNAHSQ
jgi:hypothetical protein